MHRLAAKRDTLSQNLPADQMNESPEHLGGRELSVLEGMFEHMMDLEQLADLDADGVLAAAEAAQGQMVAAECRRFVLAAHWVDLHPGEALDEQRRRSGLRVLPGMERSRRSGADGTPLVAEFAAAELGAVLGMGPVAAGCFVRDAVNVRFRHPRLWAGVLAGRVRVWQAREVARTCAAAGLDLARTGWVDEVTTPYLASLPWARFEAFLQAKVIEADPAAAEQRARAAALARFVRTGQSSEYGLRTIVARAEAGDVVFFTAMVDRVAAVLAEEGDTDPVDVRRSKAIGILARPAGALLLLQRSAERDTQDADAQAEQGDATPFLRPPVDLSKVDPKRLLPTATLYVHVSAESLRSGQGVARLEGVGPITLEQVRRFLGHTNVRPVQVIDVAGQVPVDGYEAPARMREALHLRSPACAFPWATHVSRRKDADHVEPYRPRSRGGPPGQTSMANLAWVSRFPHRLKTHGRWRLSQPAPGVCLWRSPHGYWFRVDQAGTHALGRDAPVSPLEQKLAALVRRRC